MSEPIVLGAGPAGSAAAIHLAQGGRAPILIDRDHEVGDCICGGFLSWKTAAQLRKLGCAPEALGAHGVDRLRLYAGSREAAAPLVARGYGLSRRALDTALRARAVAAGAQLEIDRAREIEPGRIVGEGRDWLSSSIFLATGKHDVRGVLRAREARDPALGLRVRLPEGSSAARLANGAIELHLFPDGYAGIVVQEDGSANICLAVRKSLLKAAGGDPWQLLGNLGEDHPHFARRLGGASRALPVDSIASVPYGWIARETDPGLYRLGDQAAVIPSLAGEGMAIALASAQLAVDCHLAGEDAATYQSRFARRARRPIGIAGAIWHVAEDRSGGKLLTDIAGKVPVLALLAMRLSRI